ncbi:MAG: S9 family peptidase [Proteobacteria bacterium]|nr:S9 family peptidase [Pseudomonadota bacterium]
MKKYFFVFYCLYSFINIFPLHAMLEEEVESLAPGICTRSEYTRAVSDLIGDLKVSYNEGDICIFNKSTAAFKTITLPGHSSTKFEWSNPPKSVYPLTNTEWLALKRVTRNGRLLSIVHKRAFDDDIYLCETRHNEHRVSLVETTPGAKFDKNRIYFSQSESFTKKGKPCSPKNKNVFLSHTRLFYFDIEESKIKEVGTFPHWSDMVHMISEGSFIFANVRQDSTRIVTFSKLSTLDKFSYPIFELSEFIHLEDRQDQSIQINAAGNKIVYLTSFGSRQAVFSPAICDLEKGTRQLLLPETALARLEADITTFIAHPITAQLLAYGEDGLRLTWRAPEVSPESSQLVDLLNSFQKERDSNLYYICGSPEEDMIFKEITPNGNYRLLAVRHKKADLEDITPSFTHTWIDLREDYKDLGISFLPVPLCSVPIHCETYISRDKASIPVYVVRPLNSMEATPGIINIHGGPQTRDEWTSADLNDARYFALLGYTTLFPQYRGGEGFGRKHLQGGFRKHTTIVPEDIIDAATWAADRGYIDRKKTIVMGSSYGAFMVPIVLRKNDKRFSFAGGIIHAGFYDVEQDMKKPFELSYHLASQDLGWGSLMSPADRIEMREASSIHFVQEIRDPLLIIHGTKDDNCAYSQATTMSKALIKARKQHAFIRFKGEGHEVSEKFHPLHLAVVERFLQMTLGGPFEPLTLQERKIKGMKIIQDSTGFYRYFK